MACVELYDPVIAPDEYAGRWGIKRGEIVWVSRGAPQIDGSCKRIVARTTKELGGGRLLATACNCEGVTLTLEPTTDPVGEPARRNFVMHVTGPTIFCGDIVLPQFMYARLPDRLTLPPHNGTNCSLASVPYPNTEVGRFTYLSTSFIPNDGCGVGGTPFPGTYNSEWRTLGEAVFEFGLGPPLHNPCVGVVGTRADANGTIIIDTQSSGPYVWQSIDGPRFRMDGGSAIAIPSQTASVIHRIACPFSPIVCSPGTFGFYGIIQRFVGGWGVAYVSEVIQTTIVGNEEYELKPYQVGLAGQPLFDLPYVGDSIVIRRDSGPRSVVNRVTVGPFQDVSYFIFQELARPMFSTEISGGGETRPCPGSNPNCQTRTGSWSFSWT